MTRSEIHADAMLRHLGAAYYESLHGRATRADVTRALETVEEHLNEVACAPSPGSPAAHGRRTGPAAASARLVPAMAWVFLTVVGGLIAYLRKPISESQIRREIERQGHS